MVKPHSESHRLRGGFDDDAVAFNRTRPVCPAELFDDLVRLGNLATGKQVVEVGAGTGQATLPLAQRGLAITAIELGPELAALARANLASFETVKVLTGSFEDWEPVGAVFDAVVAFNSLHWVDPELRYTKPARVLRPDGVLVVAGCKWATAAEAQPFWRDVQEDYRAVGAEGDPPPPPEAIGPDHLPPDARLLFDEVAAIRSVCQGVHRHRLPGQPGDPVRDPTAWCGSEGGVPCESGSPPPPGRLAEADGLIRGPADGWEGHFAGCHRS